MLESGINFLDLSDLTFKTSAQTISAGDRANQIIRMLHNGKICVIKLALSGYVAIVPSAVWNVTETGLSEIVSSLVIADDSYSFEMAETSNSTITYKYTTEAL